MSQNECSDLVDNFIRGNPTIEHAHNAFVCTVYRNAFQDSPDPGTAPWVSASTDKSSGPSTSKTVVTSDAGEQRLKTEVMALPARDRRRLKTVVTDGRDAPEEALFRRAAYEEYYHASRIKAPDSVPASAGGLTKTNWDLEIRKRYTQSLFAETLEFPDATTIHARIVPICYEESVAAGTSIQCAELVGIAAEIHVKNMLHDMFNRVRINGPRYENPHVGGPFTAKYRKKLLREEADIKAGKLSRKRDDDLLPIESREAQIRKPLCIADIKLANRVGPNLLNSMPLLGVQINESLFDDAYDDQNPTAHSPTQAAVQIQSPKKKSISAAKVNGTNGILIDDDDMDVDDDDWGWEGAGIGDREMLGGLLADCLNTGAVGA
jgi:transcriptional coactivator HFI1/ADA1